MNEERIATTSVSAGLTMTGDKPRTPEMIGAEVRMYYEAGRRVTMLCGIEIGRRLVEAKEMLGHGNWLPWLEKETPFSDRHAQNYMRVFREYGAAQLGLFGPETNAQYIADLPISKALTLLYLPESERESFAKEVDAEHLSARDLEALVKERTDELRAAKESAEAAARGAVEELKEAENAREEAEAKYLGEREAREAAEITRAEAEEQLRKIKAELDEIEKRPQATVYVPDEEAIAKAANDAADLEREKHLAEEKKLKAKIAELEAQAKENDGILRSAQDDMQKAQAEAKDAREAAQKAQQAEAEAQRLQRDVEALRKQLSMAAPAVAEFKAAFDRAQDELVHMNDALHRIEDEEIKGKLRTACTVMLDGFMGRVKE